MARDGSGDDENYSDDEPTQISNYGYGGFDQPPTDPGEASPWYRKPVALVSFGAVGAVLVALVIYGLAKAITGNSPSEPTTTPLTPLTSSSAPARAPSTTMPETTTTPTTTSPTTTTTTTTTPTTTSPTTTTTTTTPSASVSTSTSVVTQTKTETVTETGSPPTP